MDNPNNKSAATLSEEKRRLMEQMLQRKRGKVGVNAANSIPKRPADQPNPLSFAQQSLWFLDQLSPNNAAYVFTNIVRFSGKINIEVLQSSFRDIVARHEILRTHFLSDDGQPQQVIRDEISFEFLFTDLQQLSTEDSEQSLQSVARKDAQIGFDLAEGPLFRVQLIQLSELQCAVVLTLHHIVYDGWSLSVLFKEWKEFYEAALTGKENSPKPLPVQYADFSAWQHQQIDSPAYQKQLQYWCDNLAGSLPVLNLPTDRPRSSVVSNRGALQWMQLSPALSKQLESLALREDCTLYSVLFSAFVLLLSRYSGDREIIVGTPTANRNHRDVEGLIGFFVNSLPLRTTLNDNEDFCELLQRVKKITSDAFSHQDYPFEKLVEKIHIDRNVSQNPLFQVMFALQNTPSLPRSMDAVVMNVEEVDGGTSVFDLTMSLYQTAKGINGYIEYATDLYDASTVERMLVHYQLLLQSIVSHPEKLVNNLSIMSPAELGQITTVWNQTSAPKSTYQCIHHLIEQWADKKPSAVAVSAKGEILNYAQLETRANQLAHRLIESGATTDDIVGICLARSVDMFVSILAVLKAGAAYLPLDPHYPQQRLQFMVEDSRALLVITQNQWVGLLGVKSEAAICLDADNQDSFSYPDTSPSVNIGAANLAYIIYTSGSTGTPKGVMITHANIVHSTTARINYYRDPVERFLLMSSFAFDSSVAGIFWTLCQGGELHLPFDGAERELLSVAKLIDEKRITHMLSLASVYDILLGEEKVNPLSALKVVIVAGETCPNSVVKKHFSIAPNRSFFNEYGPTEGTVWATVEKLGMQHCQGVVPIGKPIENVQVYILDSSLFPVPIGVSGEIYIGGDGVANGYLGRDDLTAEKFLTTTLTDGKLYRTGDLGKFRVDGTIEFIGRTDDQVKVNGYRIEMGEIENHILAETAVENVVVTVLKSPGGDNSLVAFVATDPKNITSLDNDLRNKLPDYMVPNLMVPLDELPLNANGKVDKRALPNPFSREFRQEAVYSAPESDLQTVITNIWEGFLGCEKISIDDNFFNLGGHSILATRVVAKLHQQFEVSIPVRYLFESPTVRLFTEKLLSDVVLSADLEETASLVLQIENLSEHELDNMLDRHSDPMSKVEH